MRARIRGLQSAGLVAAPPIAISSREHARRGRQGRLRADDGLGCGTPRARGRADWVRLMVEGVDALSD